MRTWCHVSHSEPCRICGRPDWCSRSADGAWALCRRIDTGIGLHRVDRAGADYWLYRLDGHALYRYATDELPSPHQAERADPLTLNQVYRTLLATLPLSPPHRQALRQRGLSEREIVRRVYRTLPPLGRATRGRQMVADFGAELCARIPGLYRAARGSQQWWSLAGVPGLLIPVRNIDGHIVALKVRADELGAGPEYTTISSAKHGGPSPGAQVHVPLHGGSSDTVRLTEGELKSDLATVLSSLLTISIPGVAMWRKALPVLQALQAPQVLLAFDADWRTNAHVAHALGQAALALVKAGYDVQVEAWDPALGKGIDDLLAAGHTPVRHSAALAFGALLRGHARPWTGRLPTVAAEEVPPWRSSP